MSPAADNRREITFHLMISAFKDWSVEAVYLSVHLDGCSRHSLWWCWSSLDRSDPRRSSAVPLCTPGHWISCSLRITTSHEGTAHITDCAIEIKTMLLWYHMHLIWRKSVNIVQRFYNNDKKKLLMYHVTFLISIWCTALHDRHAQ